MTGKCFRLNEASRAIVREALATQIELLQECSTGKRSVDQIRELSMKVRKMQALLFRLQEFEGICTNLYSD